MNTGSILIKLKDAGVTASLMPPNGVNLKPRALVTPYLIDLVKAYKWEVMEALEGSTTANNPRPVSQQAESRRVQYMALFLGRTDANELAQQLQRRDLDNVHMRMCVECVHFTANTSCRNHKVADVPPMVGIDFSVMLQRCRGFALPPESRWNK